MEKKVKYREVADLLKQKILDGEFTDGEKLATEMNWRGCIRSADIRYVRPWEFLSRRNVSGECKGVGIIYR